MPTLNWLDRNKTLRAALQVPCRILREEVALSYGERDSANILIEGDNLHALKALLPYFRGQVKCVFIDPPYNTKNAFEHYQDSLEHSQWLDMVYPRLELLHDLLSEEGSIWVTIDDNEAHYLKVIMDEIFGRKNFIANCVWQKKHTRANDARWISDNHDHIICHAKNKEKWQRNLLPRGDNTSNYANPDNDPRGAWSSGPCHVKSYSADYDYELVNSRTGKSYFPPKGRCWMTSKERMEDLISENKIYFGRHGNSAPRYKKFLSEVKDGLVPISLWLRDEVGDNQEAKTEVKPINEENVFSTPKPERLIKRVLEIATQPGELVLDSFLGSGTTAAVAHKMGRRYIGIEMGAHARTHCATRLKKVVDGEQGGISKTVEWAGGGGFRFYQLGAELFSPDGQIHPQVHFADLAAYIWFFETRTPWTGAGDSPLLGIHDERAYYLLYNGILKDKTAHGGNIITRAVLQNLPPHKGKRIIYANGSRLGIRALTEMDIVFKPIPWAVRLDNSKGKR